MINDNDLMPYECPDHFATRLLSHFQFAHIAFKWPFHPTPAGGEKDVIAFSVAAHLEEEYKIIRAPHKIKGGVSGCNVTQFTDTVAEALGFGPP